jgi:hypothetical protein
VNGTAENDASKNFSNYVRLPQLDEQNAEQLSKPGQEHK